MNAERKNKKSKFWGKKAADITKLAFLCTSRVIEGDLEAPEIGISRLIFNRVDRIDAAHQNGRVHYFNKLFDLPPGKISSAVRKEMIELRTRNYVVRGPFDPNALVEWSLSILAWLRIALAASSDLDAKRSKARKRLLKEKRPDQRKRIVNEFLGEWLAGIRGVEADKKQFRNVALDTLFNLHTTALIAFITGVNPRVLSPLCDSGIYVDGVSLAVPLLAGAEWLGGLFRNRYLQMEYAHASHIAAFCNPNCYPLDLPADRRDEWTATTRMLTSFLTEKGLENLMAGANAVLGDGKTRSVFATNPILRRKHTASSAIAKLRRSPSIVSSLAEASIQDEAPDFSLPPPIIVEAGWVILPGDYQEAWVGQCDPFEPEDFPEHFSSRP